jgi:hypothetical protein
MEKDYKREIEELYDQALNFLQGEGWEEGQPHPIYARTGIRDIFYDEPENSLHKDRLMSLFESV